MSPGRGFCGQPPTGDSPCTSVSTSPWTHWNEQRACASLTPFPEHGGSTDTSMSGWRSEWECCHFERSPSSPLHTFRWISTLNSAFSLISKAEHIKPVFFTRVAFYWVSLVPQWYRIRLPIQNTQVPSPAVEDPLEKEMATHSGILTWKIPWTEDIRQAWGLKTGKLDLATKQQHQRFTMISDQWLTCFSHRREFC